MWKSITLKPREVIFENKRCNCENIITFEAAKENVESTGEYKLLYYAKTEEPVTIHNIKCGHDFKVSYRKFIKSPYCRECRRLELIFDKRINELTNGEYTVTGQYVDQDTKVLIRHEICQKEQLYLPRHFLSGQRCKCNYENKLDEEWNKMYFLLTEYKKNMEILIFQRENLTSLSRLADGYRDRGMITKMEVSDSIDLTGLQK